MLNSLHTQAPCTEVGTLLYCLYVAMCQEKERLKAEKKNAKKLDREKKLVCISLLHLVSFELFCRPYPYIYIYISIYISIYSYKNSS